MPFYKKSFFFIETDDFDHVSGLQYEDTVFSFLLPTNFQAFIYMQSVQLTGAKVPCEFLLEESLFT